MPPQRGGTTAVKPDPAGAPFKPGTKAYDTAVAKAKAQKATQARRAAPQALNVHAVPPTPPPNAQPKQTGSKLGLPDAGKPFQGVKGDKAPAKQPARSTPHATAQSALAKARLERLQHGGLLTPAQRAAEALASISVPTRTNFATPPPEASQKAPTRGLPRAAAGAPRGAQNGRQAMQDAARAQQGDFSLPSASDAINLARHVVDPSSLLPNNKWMDYVSTTQRFLLPNPITLTADLLTGRAQREAKGAAAAQQTVQSWIDKIKPSAPSIPSGVSVAQADLTPAARKLLAANGIKGSIPLKTLIQTYGDQMLGPYKRKQLIDMAKKNGWPQQDIAHWTDTEAASRAFNPYTHTPFGFLRNAAADISTLMAGANAAPMLAGPVIEATKGNPQPLIRTAAQFAQQWKNHLAIVGDRPILENLYQSPFTTITSNAPIVKGLGVRAGKIAGLAPTREITLPNSGLRNAETGLPSGQKVTVPATQNILTRGGTKVSDAILSRSQHPDTRHQEARLRASNPRPVAAAGRWLERHHSNKAGEVHQQMAQLSKGHEARQAQNELLAAVRGLPSRVRDLRVGAQKVESIGRGGENANRRVSNKQQHAETLVKHAHMGVSSDEAVRYYDTQIAKTDAQIATSQRVLEAARASGDEGGVEAARQAIDGLKRTRQAQVTQREFSAKNPVDIHNLSPAETRVVDAFRNASQVITRLKGESGKMGEAGTLYGDLAHNLELEATLHPDTPAGALARTVLGHREVMTTLEEKMGSLGERTSPAAKEQLGRVKVLAQALADISGRRTAVAERAARGRATVERQARKPVTVSTHATREEANAARAGHEAANPGHTSSVHEVRVKNEPSKFELRSRPPQGGTPIEAAMASAGVRADTLHRIVQEGRSALTAKRERHSLRVRAEQKIANEMEVSQRAAHEKVAGKDLRVEKIKLQNAQNRTLSPVEKIAAQGRAEVDRLTPVVSTLEARLAHFEPDQRLVAQRAKVERMKGENAALELSPGQSSAIARRHVTAAQEQAIGATTLHDAIHENQRVGADRELSRLQQRLQAQHDTAAAHFERVSGSKAAASLRHEQESQAFVARMKEFQALQSTRGIDPFHVTLHRPGDRVGTIATKQSRDVQFPEGNYTHDIHIQVSADLEANARAAVEAELFRSISNTPYVIQDPPPNSRVPPGFALTEADALKNPRKPIYGTESNEDLLTSWQKQTRSSHEYVPATGKYVLVSKDMQSWLKETLNPKLDFDNAKLNAILRFTNQYRRWMLFSLPRTLVNNALGNAALAAIGGAGIIDYMRSVHLLRQHPELIPSTMRHIGPIANVGETLKLTGYQAFWRNANVFHEDLGRLTVYMHHVIRAAKHDQGLRFYNRIDMGSELTTNFLKGLAEGKNPDVLKFTDEATRWFGNMAKRNKWDPVLATGFLFHRWVGHMIHLTLWTMPAKYPGRMAFALNLSQMADNYRKEHGNFPDWAKPIVGLFNSIDKVGGLPQKVLWGLNTGGINPFATPGQTLNLGSDASQGGNPVGAILSANANPLAQVLFAFGSGKRLSDFSDLKDTTGAPVGPLDWHTGIHQLIANTPVVSSASSAAGQADNSIQVLPNQPRRYSKLGLRDPQYYPPGQPGSLLWNILDRLSAMGGFRVSPIDSTGPRTSIQAQRAVAGIASKSKTHAQNVAALHAAAAQRIARDAGKSVGG